MQEVESKKALKKNLELMKLELNQPKKKTK